MTLAPDEIRDFRSLAGFMIPANAEYGVPGADDEAIFGDILKSLGRDCNDVAAALHRLATIAGGSFAALPAGRQAEIAAIFHAEGGASVNVLNRVVLLGYYRDDRVMQALGMETRPPFPKGHVVEQGDWSLLDPVRGAGADVAEGGIGT